MYDWNNTDTFQRTFSVTLDARVVFIGPLVQVARINAVTFICEHVGCQHKRAHVNQRLVEQKGLWTPHFEDSRRDNSYSYSYTAAVSVVITLLLLYMYRPVNF